MVRMRLALLLCCALACSGCELYLPEAFDRAISAKSAEAERNSLTAFQNAEYFTEAASRFGDAAGRGRDFLKVTVYADGKLDAYSFSDGSIFLSHGMVVAMEDSEAASLGLVASLAVRSFDRLDVKTLKASLFNPGEILYILMGGRGIQSLPKSLHDKIMEHLVPLGHRVPDPLEVLPASGQVPLDDVFYYQADASAMRLIVSMGVPPDQSFAFLEKLVAAKGRYQDSMPYLSRGGPSLDDRLVSARSYAKILANALAAIQPPQPAAAAVSTAAPAAVAAP